MKINTYYNVIIIIVIHVVIIVCSGKTVLAAESVRQASLLREVFPGGVFWLSVGKMKDDSGEVNKDALLEKIQNFIYRMDRNKARPLNLEQATDHLQVKVL